MKKVAFSLKKMSKNTKKAAPDELVPLPNIPISYRSHKPSAKIKPLLPYRSPANCRAYLMQDIRHGGSILHIIFVNVQPQHRAGTELVNPLGIPAMHMLPVGDIGLNLHLAPAFIDPGQN